MKHNVYFGKMIYLLMDVAHFLIYSAKTIIAIKAPIIYNQLKFVINSMTVVAIVATRIKPTKSK